MNGGMVPFIAVNIGNTTAQFARVTGYDAQGTPDVDQVLELASHELDVEQLGSWLSTSGSCPWYIASVFRAADERLRAWIAESLPTVMAKRLSAVDFGMAMDVQQPERVGMDRLAAAAAAWHHKSPDRPACIVDAGTAITIDALAANGTFLGGAICPGLGIAARALHRYTDALPLVWITGQETPPAIGKNTEAAITSGLYWGAVGTVDRIVEQIANALGTPDLELFLTGGMRKALAGHLSRPAREMPTLVLQGVALAAQRLRTSSPGVSGFHN